MLGDGNRPHNISSDTLQSQITTTGLQNACACQFAEAGCLAQCAPSVHRDSAAILGFNCKSLRAPRRAIWQNHPRVSALGPKRGSL